MNTRKRMVAVAAFGMWAQVLAHGAPGHADDGRALEFSGSGFLTVAAGRILGGTHDPATEQGYNCPCFISDYAQAGVYQNRGWEIGPDSKLGLQGTVSAANGRYALTGQVISRGAAQGRANLEWLYGTVELNGRLTLQLGRKRLPLFAYSEAQDVGFALPWIHLPPQLYGWEIVNYNGASLTWREQWGDWSSTLNVFGGGETKRDSGYWKLYNGKDSRTDARWSDIRGAELGVTRDWFGARLVYIQSDTQNRRVSEGETDFSGRKRQRIHGLSFNADHGGWVGRAEFLYIDRSQDYGKDFSQLYAVGHRFGRLTPLVSYANYRQQTKPGGAAAEGHSTLSLVLRYDLTDASALKAQFDSWKDKSAPGYASMHGDARLITLSYDRVF